MATTENDYTVLSHLWLGFIFFVCVCLVYVRTYVCVCVCVCVCVNYFNWRLITLQ